MATEDWIRGLVDKEQANIKQFFKGEKFLDYGKSSRTQIFFRKVLDQGLSTGESRFLLKKWKLACSLSLNLLLLNLFIACTVRAIDWYDIFDLNLRISL